MPKLEISLDSLLVFLKLVIGGEKKELGHHSNELGDNKECQIGAKGIKIEYGR